MKVLLLLYNWVVELIFPAYCLGCGRAGGYLCGKCIANTGEAKESLDLICCSQYDKHGVLARLVMRFKYGGVENVLEALKPLILRGSEKLKHRLVVLGVENWAEVVIVPVPIARKRLKQRGFNQAELLAMELKKNFKERDGPRILKNLLLKSDRPKQSILSRKERLENLKGAIKVNPKVADLAVGKVVILVDDVATTLSTINECKRVLATAGAVKVIALVLARARSI